MWVPSCVCVCGCESAGWWRSERGCCCCKGSQSAGRDESPLPVRVRPSCRQFSLRAQRLEALDIASKLHATVRAFAWDLRSMLRNLLRQLWVWAGFGRTQRRKEMGAGEGARHVKKEDWSEGGTETLGAKRHIRMCVCVVCLCGCSFVRWCWRETKGNHVFCFPYVTRISSQLINALLKFACHAWVGESRKADHSCFTVCGCIFRVWVQDPPETEGFRLQPAGCQVFFSMLRCSEVGFSLRPTTTVYTPAARFPIENKTKLWMYPSWSKPLFTQPECTPVPTPKPKLM